MVAYVAFLEESCHVVEHVVSRYVLALSVFQDLKSCVTLG